MAMRYEKESRESANCKVLATRHTANFALRKNAYKEGTKSSAHAHENARFVFVLRGSFSEAYGRRNRQCTPFITIFRPPGERHAEHYHGRDIVCLSADIQPAWLEGLRRYDLNLNESGDFKCNNLMSLMTRLNGEIVNRDNISSLAIEALMLEIAVEVYRREKGRQTKCRNPLWLGDVKDYIQARLVSPLTISEIAGAVNVHPVHLARVFRQNCGCTVAEYIRRLRVEHACTRLSSAESLVEIALNSGFSDQSHFSKTFKQVMNITPGEYRTAINSR